MMEYRKPKIYIVSHAKWYARWRAAARRHKNVEFVSAWHLAPELLPENMADWWNNYALKGINDCDALILYVDDVDHRSPQNLTITSFNLVEVGAALAQDKLIFVVKPSADVMSPAKDIVEEAQKCVGPWVKHKNVTVVRNFLVALDRARLQCNKKLRKEQSKVVDDPFLDMSDIEHRRVCEVDDSDPALPGPKLSVKEIADYTKHIMNMAYYDGARDIMRYMGAETKDIQEMVARLRGKNCLGD